MNYVTSVIVAVLIGLPGSSVLASGADAPDSPIAHGARLAAIGGCAGCHSRQDGAPYAGGLALATPFGTIYSTNITPDSASGIGTWSEQDFVRAMRMGIDPRGQHLYPAFPYDHFTHASDADLDALYVFLRSVEPVRAIAQDNQLAFPFDFRGTLLVWDALYLDAGALPVDAAHGSEVDRGRYLVESLGHCGGCHTPRNALGAEKRGEELDGAPVDGWYAPPLDQHSPSPMPWTVKALTDYLKSGIASDHAIAGGPMQDVIFNLSQGGDDDLRAIAVYLVASMDVREPQRVMREQEARALASRVLSSVSVDGKSDDIRFGKLIYDDACASCHDGGRQVSSAGALELPLAIAVRDADPKSLLRIIREGIVPRTRARGRFMPAFDGILTDAQIEALAAFLRDQAGHAAPWPDLAKAVAESAM